MGNNVCKTLNHNNDLNMDLLNPYYNKYKQ